jgi:hypothetical protein
MEKQQTETLTCSVEYSTNPRRLIGCQPYTTCAIMHITGQPLPNKMFVKYQQHHLIVIYSRKNKKKFGTKMIRFKKAVPFLKVAILWDIKPCSPYMNHRFGGKNHLHLQDRKRPNKKLA